jgi:hypothetical protein
VAAAPVTGAAGLLELYDHLRVVVLVALVRLAQLERIVAKEHAEDRLELHEREGRSDAAVAPGTEGNPREALAVFVPLFAVALRIVAVRLRKALGHAVRNCGRYRHQLAGRDREALVVEVEDHLPHQEDQRRVQPEALLDPGFEDRDLA